NLIQQALKSLSTALKVSDNDNTVILVVEMSSANRQFLTDTFDHVIVANVNHIQIITQVGRVVALCRLEKNGLINLIEHVTLSVALKQNLRSEERRVGKE